MIQFLHLHEIPKRMSVKMKTIGKKERKKGCCGVHTYNCMKPSLSQKAFVKVVTKVVFQNEEEEEERKEEEETICRPMVTTTMIVTKRR